MSTEEMKQALKLLKSAHVATDLVWERHDCVIALEKAIQEEALRNVQRLGQEIEQEPVAWAYVNKDGECEQIEWGEILDDSSITPLYAHPQIEQDWSTQDAALESLREHMARIKELETQIEQMKAGKPVAWMDSSGHPKHLRHIQGSEERRLYGELQPLYLHAATTCSGCGESSTKDGFLATYCLKCCEMANGKQTTHHWYDTGYDTGYVDGKAVSDKPLTDEQIETIGDQVANMPLIGVVPNFRVRLARAIEAAHGIKEKNT